MDWKNLFVTLKETFPNHNFLTNNCQIEVVNYQLIIVFLRGFNLKSEQQLNLP